jgi:hypothetical protein
MSDRPRKPPLPSRRWFRAGLGLAIAGNLLGAGSAMYLLGGSHDVSVDEALQRFRERDATATGAPTPGGGVPTPTPSVTSKANAGQAKKTGTQPTAPGSSVVSRPPLEEGVYVYATEGYEETDALSGQRHDYPAETTITVSKQGCGYRWRWQPLKERWEESDGCRTSKGYVLERFAIYHEFFKRGILEDFACEPDAVVMPEVPVVGASWRWQGASDDSTIDTLTKVVGFETITVGSKQVRTLHMRYETTLKGSNDGTQTQDRWLDEDSGLLVRMINAVDATAEVPFGGKANYTERYRIDLTSTKPVS